MNKLIAISFATLLAASLQAYEPGGNGGWLERPQSGRVIHVINDQDAVDAKVVASAVSAVDEMLGLKLVLADNDENAAAAVHLKSNADDPILLVASENGWAKINVGKLVAGSPSQKLCLNRLTKELCRSVAILLGAGHSQFLPDILGPIRSIAELDSIPSCRLCPEAENAIVASAKKLNIVSSRKVPYRIACREGWAPPPTNDIQKAIWEKVHAPPTKPMKITYDKDKQKPVVK